MINRNKEIEAEPINDIRVYTKDLLNNYVKQKEKYGYDRIINHLFYLHITHNQNFSNLENNQWEKVFEVSKQLDLPRAKIFEYLTKSNVKLVTDKTLPDSLNLDTLIDLSNFYFVEKKSIEWFMEDMRNLFWFLKKITELCIFKNHTLTDIEHLKRFSILYFDIVGYVGKLPIIVLDNALGSGNIFSNAEKNLTFSREYKKYSEQIRRFDKKFKWFDENNQHQIEWLYNYLKNDKHLILSDLFIATTVDQKVAQIKASFDDLDDINLLYELNKNNTVYSPSEIKLAYLKKLSSKWSQKKFKDSGQTKTNFHLPLAKDTTKKLKKIAAFYNLSNEKTIQKLVDKEYKENFLDENGKEIY